jgi:hypothetical protein
MAASFGRIQAHRGRQVMPSWRANPATEACSRRSCPIAHQVARVEIFDRGAATSVSCSVNDPTSQAPSGQDQVRLRHRNRTGRPKQGVSTTSWTRRPWETATTPHTGHPIGPGGDSIVTTKPGPSRATATTW